MTDIWRFSNSGRSLGPLTYDSATHEEDLDGTDKLTVICQDDPQKRDRLVWMDSAGDWHEHIVDSTIRVHGSARPRTVATCSNSVSELFGAYTDGTLVKDDVQSILATLLADVRWAPGACDDFGVVELEVWHKNVRQCLNELCEMVNGELETSVSVGSDGVVSRTLGIVRQRGSNLVAREFSWGVNASNIKREVGADEVYTAIVGYGANTDASDHSDYSERISVTVESDLDLSTWGIPNGDGTFSHNYTTYTDNACTDRSFLAKQCSVMLNSVSVPMIRYEFDAAQVDEASWADVTLGTVVLCTDLGFNPPLYLRERVSHIRREFGGRMAAMIAIGSRTNPMVERFKSEERIARSLTGNGARFSRPSYTRGNYGNQYQAKPIATQPDELAVTTLPDKTFYQRNETFDFTGLVAKLYLGGELFQNEWYPDGIVPLNELTFDPMKAPPKASPAGERDESLGDKVVRRWGTYFDGNDFDVQFDAGPFSEGDNPVIVQYSAGEIREVSGVKRQDVTYRIMTYQTVHGESRYSPAQTGGSSCEPSMFFFSGGGDVVIYRYENGTSAEDFDDPNTDPDMPNAISSMNYGFAEVTVLHSATNLSTTFDMRIDASIIYPASLLDQG